MAFGSMAKYRDEVSTESDGEAKIFEQQFMNTRSGNRKFRLFPDESETMFVFAWWPCQVKGETKNVRMFMDYEKRWTNPMWTFLADKYPPKSQQRRAQKVGFAINVYDMTSVITTDSGVVIYPDERGRYIDKDTKKEVAGTPAPLNRVRILEGTAGDLPGKHLYAKLVSACTGIVDPDDNPKKPHEVDLILKTTGTTMDNTERAFSTGSSFKPLSPEVLALPRWDIKRWVTPWPDEAITALINGVDFVEVVKEFPDILANRFPVKIGEEPSSANEEDLFGF